MAKKCVGMINIDTVGQIKDNKILVIGAQSAKEWKELLERASLVSLLKVDFYSDGPGFFGSKVIP